jgi:dTDP-glucose pyrophosphorylase/CBS domain-containing protein
MRDLDALFVDASSSVRAAIGCIDRNAAGIALVVDKERRLIGTVTDGDVRRAILAGLSIEEPIETLLANKPEPAPRIPTTAPVGTAPSELLDLMNRYDLRHIPVVDAEGRVVGIEMLRDLVLEYQLPLRAMVMAGGFGRRLRPLTDDLPKAMLPIGGRPLLEIIVRRLQQAGIRRVHVATHYKAEVIQEHFGDGQRFDLDIHYVNEDQPLGTAGALGLLAQSDEPLLVINGDILTHVNVSSMLEFHRSNRADLTVAVSAFEIEVPYGVVRTDGLFVTGVDEKPTIRSYINAGVYLLSPEVCRLVPSGRPCDMPELIGYCLDRGLRVISFPLREYWQDIGRRDDYSKALRDAQEGKA